jgi:hypothetical protein
MQHWYSASKMIEFEVHGIGAWGPGFGNWTQLVEGVDTGCWSEQTPLQPERIPPRERRRSPHFVKIAVEVMSQACAQACADPEHLAVVFSTAMSDMRTNDYMCRTLVDAPAAVSPTKFHNSVNNAATGYWSIATGCLEPSNALCGFRQSAGIGLLEAAAQVQAERRPVLLVVQDEAAPPPLEHICPSSVDLALAVLLAPRGGPGKSLGRWRFETEPGGAPCTPLPGSVAARFAGNPAADLLPFLLANVGDGTADAAIRMALNGALKVRLSPAREAGEAA